MQGESEREKKNIKGKEICVDFDDREMFINDVLQSYEFDELFMYQKLNDKFCGIDDETVSKLYGDIGKINTGGEENGESGRIKGFELKTNYFEFGSVNGGLNGDNKIDGVREIESLGAFGGGGLEKVEIDSTKGFMSKRNDSMPGYIGNVVNDANKIIPFGSFCEENKIGNNMNEFELNMNPFEFKGFSLSSNGVNCSVNNAAKNYNDIYGSLLSSSGMIFGVHGDVNFSSSCVNGGFHNEGYFSVDENGGYVKSTYDSVGMERPCSYLHWPIKHNGFVLEEREGHGRDLSDEGLSMQPFGSILREQELEMELQSYTRTVKNGFNGNSPISMNGSFIIQENGCDYTRKRGQGIESFVEIYKQTFKGKGGKFGALTTNRGTRDTSSRLIHTQKQPIQWPRTLAEVRGCLFLLALEQNGCQDIQNILRKGTNEDVQTVFDEIINHVIELMMDRSGNYVMQKLLEVCNEDQRWRILLVICENPSLLVSICINQHGTRVVQKLIETLNIRQHIELFTFALRPGLLDITKNQYGNHVIQHCLQFLSYQDNEFLFYAAARFCFEISTDEHGCCIMQRFVNHSIGEHRHRIISEVCNKAFLLAENRYGNYVVQHVIEKEPVCTHTRLLSQFKDHFVQLSTNMYGSHVVEKCLKFVEKSRPWIATELLSVFPFKQLLQHDFANYVILSALQTVKGPLLHSLVQRVKCYPKLRKDLHCRRIFSQIDKIESQSEYYYAG